MEVQSRLGYLRQTDGLQPGWRIKHAKHNQSGKERNLGFGSILQASQPNCSCCQCCSSDRLWRYALTRRIYQLGARLRLDRAMGSLDLRVVPPVDSTRIHGTWPHPQLDPLDKHFVSLSPLFNAFVTQIHADSILANLTFGGCLLHCHWQQIRNNKDAIPSFYSGFAGPSLYLRMRVPLILVFASMAMWVPHLVYFWVTISHDHLSTPVRLHRATTGLLRVLEMATAWKLHTTSWIS
ncbi:MAG: 1,3-beta-glucan synthase component-domain-containing protein [Benniella sp.]|nr:MAG: 1,3-beta-glucan synthase component-domain-containing protein [Benniella sp.]